MVTQQFANCNKFRFNPDVFFCTDVINGAVRFMPRNRIVVRSECAASVQHDEFLSLLTFDDGYE
jgi:hypothetical protein